MIFRMKFKVVNEFLDFGGENSDLNVTRTGVSFVSLKLFYNALLLFRIYHTCESFTELTKSMCLLGSALSPEGIGIIKYPQLTLKPDFCQSREPAPHRPSDEARPCAGSIPYYAPKL